MRVGRPPGFICDNQHCQEHFTEGEILVTPEVEYHWCSQQCRHASMLEELHDEIVEEVEQKVQEEMKYLHDLVCPACKYRIFQAQ